MLFSNLFLAVTLTVLWPLVLLGLLAASAWLERRTLATEEVVPRRLQRMDRKPPEAVEAMVLEETAEVVAAYWSATGRPAPRISPDGQPAAGSARAAEAGRARPWPVGGGRHARRTAGGRTAGRHERRR
jgi:hypothetical protein